MFIDLAIAAICVSLAFIAGYSAGTSDGFVAGHLSGVRQARDSSLRER